MLSPWETIQLRVPVLLRVGAVERETSGQGRPPVAFSGLRDISEAILKRRVAPG